MISWERKFRFIEAPCCGYSFEWLGSRKPNFCPECGQKWLGVVEVDATTLILGHVSITSQDGLDAS